jgi:ribosomal protein S18 acetylase RimI-like enzyme
MTLVHWTGDDVVKRLDEALTVYAEAMGYSPDLAAARRGFLYAHTHRLGFRAVASLSEHDRVLGFGYGYTSARGQWWHEQVRAALSPEACANWLTSTFEVVELHVRPDAQGRGLGERQLIALLEGTPERNVVLSTPEAPWEDSRAWRLYRRLGFVDLLRQFHFPGDDRPFAVLGRHLPLDFPPAGGARSAG